MARRLPPLNPLRAFEATARYGSLTRAAAELNVTHGAVSHQIKALEASLNAKLFERSGQRLKLTAQGADLLPAVAGAFESIAAATARMTRPTGSGSLVVSCVPALLSLWILPRLGGFAARYPNIRLKMVPSNAPEDLMSQEIDICVHYGHRDWGDCWFRKWSDLELFPVASPTLMNNRPIRSVRDLADHVLLHGDDGREWKTWLAAADALDLARGQQLQLSDARLSTEAALHGLGVALGDSVTASGLLARGQLVTPFNIRVPAVDSFYVACRSGVRSEPVAQAFIDWLFAERDTAATQSHAGPTGPIGIRKQRRRQPANSLS